MRAFFSTALIYKSRYLISRSVCSLSSMLYVENMIQCCFWMNIALLSSIAPSHSNHLRTHLPFLHLFLLCPDEFQHYGILCRPVHPSRASTAASFSLLFVCFFLLWSIRASSFVPASRFSFFVIERSGEKCSPYTNLYHDTVSRASISVEWACCAVGVSLFAGACIRPRGWGGAWMCRAVLHVFCSRKTTLYEGFVPPKSSTERTCPFCNWQSTPYPQLPVRFGLGCQRRFLCVRTCLLIERRLHRPESVWELGDLHDSSGTQKNSPHELNSNSCLGG